MSDDDSRLRALEAIAEQAYDAMCEAGDNSAATVCFSDTEECFRDATGLAHRMGVVGNVDRRSQRLAHVKAVFRSPFTSYDRATRLQSPRELTVPRTAARWLVGVQTHCSRRA